MSDASDELRRYEIRWSAYKAIGVALVSTCVVGVFSAILNWQIQNKTLEIEREQTKRAQRITEFERQQEYLSQFTEYALTENLQSRLDFASYVAHVAMDESLRTLWRDYSATLQNKAAQTRTELAEARQDLRALVTETEGTASEMDSEMAALRQRIAAMTGELTSPRRRTEDPAVAMPALHAKLVSAQSDGQNLDVVLEIKNVSSEEFGVALIEPSSQAVLGDREYGLLSVSGVRPCKSIRDCRSNTDFAPLPPGATLSILCVFAMYGDQPETPARLMLDFAVLSTDPYGQPIITTVGIGVPGLDLALFD